MACVFNIYDSGLAFPYSSHSNYFKLPAISALYDLLFVVKNFVLCCAEIYKIVVVFIEINKENANQNKIEDENKEKVEFDI